MKEFNLQNYDHPNKVLRELTEELTKISYEDLDVTHATLGAGYIDSVEYHDGSIHANVCYDDLVDMRAYDLVLALKSKTVNLVNENVLNIVETYLNGFDKVKAEFDAHMRVVAEENARLAAIEQAKHAKLVELAKERKAKEEAELKAKKRTEAMIDKLNSVKYQAKHLVAGNDAVDYLRNNLTSITATMPDTLEDWFVKTFGENAEHRTVSHLKKTSGGYKMQFSLSIKGHLKNTENLPAELTNSVKGKELRNTALLFKLVLDEGFTFGKQGANA